VPPIPITQSTVRNFSDVAKPIDADEASNVQANVTDDLVPINVYKGDSPRTAAAMFVQSYNLTSSAQTAVERSIAKEAKAAGAQSETADSRFALGLLIPHGLPHVCRSPAPATRPERDLRVRGSSISSCRI
jgi:hypothetical protein